MPFVSCMCFATWEVLQTVSTEAEQRAASRPRVPPPPIECGRWSCPKQGSFSGLPCGLFVLPLPGNLQPWAGTGVSQGCAQQQAGECSFRWNWDPGSAFHKDLGLGERIATNAFVLFFFYFPQMLLRELR